MAKRVRPNRLAQETSPYLLQHAWNPVDWLPWSREALEKAKREHKSIFLSIGYAACHWCHVMEQESYEDEETAAVINEHFIPVKVDREERPDLDALYMQAVQMMTGSGGWPLNVFLTPDLEPFWGGTYFPPEPRWGKPSFRQVLLEIAHTYTNRLGEVQRGARRVSEILRRLSATEAPGKPTSELIRAAVSDLLRKLDQDYGGFGGAPKFPNPGALSLLLRHHRRHGDEASVRAATLTLTRMAEGAIFDQLAGGFHRYSTDARWAVPHFEKMLYDNALLASVYLEAFQVVRDPLYARAARETFGFVCDEMSPGHGGFFSSMDADTEGTEGKYYLWTRRDIREALGEEDGQLVASYYGVTEEGNFEGSNTLRVARRLEDLAEELKLSLADAERRLGEARGKLLRVRSRRVRPAKDGKILADWNGMMISSLARGAEILQEAALAERAASAASFITSEMIKDGVLMHSWKDGAMHVPGYLDDYAFTVAALIDLYEATFDPAWIRKALELSELMIDRFHDAAGGLFATAADHGTPIARGKTAYDSPTPSGNSVACMNLLRLATLTGRSRFHTLAEGILQTFEHTMRTSPAACYSMLCALDFFLGPVVQVAVAGDARAEDTTAILRTVHWLYAPNKVLALWDPSARSAGEAAELIPLLKDRRTIKGKAAAYVCEDFACRTATTEPAKLAQALQGTIPKPAH